MCCIIIVIEQRTGEAHPTAHHTAHTARSYCSSSRDSIAGAFVIIPPTPILIKPPPGSCGTLSTNPGCPATPTGYDAACYDAPGYAVAVANLPHNKHIIAIQIHRVLEWGWTLPLRLCLLLLLLLCRNGRGCIFARYVDSSRSLAIVVRYLLFGRRSCCSCFYFFCCVGSSLYRLYLRFETCALANLYIYIYTFYIYVLIGSRRRWMRTATTWKQQVPLSNLVVYASPWYDYDPTYKLVGF